METVTESIIELLRFLLPGFFAAWVFYELTSHPRPSQFERVIQALIFTVIVQAIVAVLKWVFFFVGDRFWMLGVWNSDVELTWLVVVALGWGVLLTAIAEHDLVHSFARRIRLTRSTSFASEWYGALADYRGYIVLHLIDERRLFGYPKTWPADPKRGHFLMIRASWLSSSAQEPGPISDTLESSERGLLISATDVKMVEFPPFDWNRT